MVEVWCSREATDVSQLCWLAARVRTALDSLDGILSSSLLDCFGLELINADIDAIYGNCRQGREP